MICPDANNQTRQCANQAYEKILKTLFDSLESPDNSPAAMDDNVNAQIAIIENMHYLYSEMRSRRLVSLEAFVKQAKATYDANLKIYCSFSIRKPFHRLQV